MNETSAPTRADAPPAVQEGADGEMTTLMYLDDSKTRGEIHASVDRKAAKELPEIAWEKVATLDMPMLEVHRGGCSLMILDAGAPKLGGMGLGKTVHDGADPSVPFTPLVARPQGE